MSKRKNQSDGASDGPFDPRSQINSPILAQKFASRPLKQSIATQPSPISSPYMLPTDGKLHSWINPRSFSSNYKTSFVELPSDDSPLIKHQTSPSLQKMYSFASKSNHILSPAILLSPNKVHHIWRNSPHQDQNHRHHLGCYSTEPRSKIAVPCLSLLLTTKPSMYTKRAIIVHLVTTRDPPIKVIIMLTSILI